MKYLTLVLALLLIGFTSIGQIVHGKFNVPGYGDCNMATYTPSGTPAGRKLPTFIFFHGNGEDGTNIELLYTHGPLRYIRNGWRPDFIVVGVQALHDWPGYPFALYAINHLKNNNSNFDVNKFYLTGLSAGAQCIFLYNIQTPDNQFIKPAAIIPFSITTNAQCGDFYQNTDYLCGTDLRYANIAAWGFCGSGDSHFHKMKRFVDRLIQAGYQARWTTYSGAHCCWNNYYNPTYKESINGIQMNIYDWALQYPLTSTPAVWGYLKYDSFLGEIQWSTESESNVDRFEIERSEDGINWSTVGSTPSKNPGGNSSVVTKYSYKLR